MSDRSKAHISIRTPSMTSSTRLRTQNSTMGSNVHCISSYHGISSCWLKSWCFLGLALIVVTTSCPDSEYLQMPDYIYMFPNGAWEVRR